ncbi:MAG: DUF3299 domain-containing protein [Gemmatimonadetes bacterium]|nr:DUF3299 domain-containing protein [Gemmatimonadota bacterium]
MPILFRAGLAVLFVLCGATASAQSSPALSTLERAATPAAQISWRLLSGMNYRTGLVSDTLKALDGKRVRIAAFIVPLEDNMQQADQFLLVPYFGACVHTPPPPPNQMVYVKMPPRKTMRIGWWEPVFFEGILRVKTVQSPFGVVAFEMEGIASTPYKAS